MNTDPTIATLDPAPSRRLTAAALACGVLAALHGLVIAASLPVLGTSSGGGLVRALEGTLWVGPLAALVGLALGGSAFVVGRGREGRFARAVVALVASGLVALGGGAAVLVAASVPTSLGV